MSANDFLSDFPVPMSDPQDIKPLAARSQPAADTHKRAHAGSMKALAKLTTQREAAANARYGSGPDTANSASHGVNSIARQSENKGSAQLAAVATAQSQRAVQEMLRGLNEPQHAAVTYDGDYLLVVAGAGSGKTRVLTTRISYLIAIGALLPREVLAITFTNKAAKEMRERLAGMLGAAAHSMWIFTFHAACVRILRAEHEALGMRSSFTIYDQADSQRLMKTVLAEENIDAKSYPPKTMAFAVSELKNEMIRPAEYAAMAKSKDEIVIARAYQAYQDRLQAAQAFDFDDLIMRTVLLLREHPQIAQKYRQRFRHVLVDEYQDTNVAQYQLVRTLIGELADPEHSRLTVVGDADQSIYAFRGATVRNIQDFEHDFPRAETIVLEQNYRSTQNILSAANAVIAHNEGRRAKNLWTDAGAGEPLVGYVADSERDEASFVVDEIDALRSHSGYHFQDFAVFYRTNAQSRAIEEMFVRSGIPYKVVGGTKFYERQEIKDALAYLHAIVNPDDAVSLRRIINQPRRGIGDKAEGALTAHARRWGVSFGMAIADAAHSDAALAAGRQAVAGLTPRALKAVTEFAQLLEELRELAESGAKPEDVLEAMLEKSGYSDMLNASHDPQDEGRLENLSELSSVAADFSQATPAGTLADFLNDVALSADSDQIPDAQAAADGEVVLMTIHTAKGLEFPVVFVTGMEDGIFPHIRAMESPEEMAEERRLAYVALTRARQRLYITWAAARSQWGAPHEQIPSRFLQEIPAEVIEWRRDESQAARASLFDDGWGDSWDDDAWGESRRGGSGSGWRNTGRSTRRSGDSWGRRTGRGHSGGAGARGGAGRADYARRSADESDFGPAIGGGSGKFVPGKLGGGSAASRAAGSASGSSKLAATAGQASAGGNSGGDDGRRGFATGDTVTHKSFGRGKIIAFEGSGSSTVAEVKFANGARKRLLLRVAPLSKA